MPAEPKLYVIGTPIGNRHDITQRAIETLRSAQVCFAEDTRELVKLLSLLEIPKNEKKIFSLGNHNLKESVAFAVEWLKRGSDIAFVCDRGTPGISDPGGLLVKEARANGFSVVPIPGVSALTTFLSVSGNEISRFHFFGFLKPEERKEAFEFIQSSNIFAVFFESPNRVKALVGEIQAFFKSGTLILGRELTKVFETVESGPLQSFDIAAIPELGEFVIGFLPDSSAKEINPDEVLQREIKRRLFSEKEWAKEMAKMHGLSAQDFYNALQKEKPKK